MFISERIYLYCLISVPRPFPICTNIMQICCIFVCVCVCVCVYVCVEYHIPVISFHILYLIIHSYSITEELIKCSRTCFLFIIFAVRFCSLVPHFSTLPFFILCFFIFSSSSSSLKV